MKRLLIAFLALLVVPIVAARTADASFVPDGCSSGVSGDFNGDGFDDLAIGVPLEDVSGHADAGAVNVIYGSSTGLASAGNQLWTQDSPSVEGVAEAGDRFGACLAAGDFDNDGHADLAIGVPGENVGSIVDAGLVNVLYGSDGGLAATGTGIRPNQVWTQDSPSVQGTAERNDRFGSALAAGDFNMDAADDLAIGDPGEDIRSINEAGAVNVLYGSTEGIGPLANQIWFQDSPGIEGTSETGDNFGSSLAAGDITGDGRSDLAIGVPLEDIGRIADAGAVSVLYATATGGLSSSKDQLWYQNSTAVAGTSESGDLFGDAVALGDVDGNGNADLIAGVPLEDVSGAGANAGAFNLLYGSATGLITTGNKVVVGTHAGDFLGATLAVGGFNFPPGADDLAVGAPGRNIAGENDAGSVLVFSDDVTTPGTEWSQDSADVEDDVEDGDVFGAALVSGDYDGDPGGFSDLAIGVPGEDFPVTDAGQVQVIYGSVTGLDPSQSPFGNDDQVWRQGTGGISDTPEAQDFFGSTLG
jgi:hypothetical protein